MTYDGRDVARVRNPVLIVSALTWILLLAAPGSMVTLAHCAATSSGAMPLRASFQMLLAMNSLASLAVGWALMLAAMMSPVLIAPLNHVRLRSFTNRRARSMMLFVAGYAAIWIPLGGALLAIELGVKLYAPELYLPAAGLVLVALVWQCSPIKRRCLNRCHAHTELAAFGAAADFDALRFGMTHGIWCAGSCWALMLFPMVLPRGHVVAMAAVAVLIFSERLERPTAPCWRWRGLGKVIRIGVAQARMRAHALQISRAPFSSSA